MTRGEVCGQEGGGAKGVGQAQVPRTGRTRDCEGLGGRGFTRGESTWNMLLMFLTLDVSKLRVWLKA